MANKKTISLLASNKHDSLWDSKVIKAIYEQLK